MSTPYSGASGHDGTTVIDPGLAARAPADDQHMRPDGERASLAAAPTEGEQGRTRHRVTALIASGTLAVGLIGGVGIGRATAPASTGVSGQSRQGGFGGFGGPGAQGGTGTQGGAGGTGTQGGAGGTGTQGGFGGPGAQGGTGPQGFQPGTTQPGSAVSSAPAQPTDT